MNALVAYEPGDAEVMEIAAAIADGLADAGAVTRMVPAGAAPLELDDVDLLIVGGRSAAPGLAQWIRTITPHAGMGASAFEVVDARGPVTGAAGVGRLRRRGLDVVLVPERFTVDAAHEGEWERARAWGRAICVVARPAAAGTR